MTTTETEEPVVVEGDGLETDETMSVQVAEVRARSFVLPAGWRSRASWGALPPKGNPGQLRSLDSQTLHYTGGSNAPADHAKCDGFVRAIQKSHQSIAAQTDIEYMALVCPHGTIYEGRVWGYKGGANGTASANSYSSSVCALIGITSGKPTPPTPTLLLALDKAFRDIAAAYAVTLVPRWPHHHWKATACPGVPLDAWLSAGCPTAPTAPVAPATPTFPGTAKLGDRGPVVLSWQNNYIAHNVISNNAANRDSYYGSGMEAATIDLQQSFGWSDADGIAGQHTWNHLNTHPCATCKK